MTVWGFYDKLPRGGIMITSETWYIEENRLLKLINQLDFQSQNDLKIMLNAISKKVEELSKHEVKCRQSRRLTREFLETQKEIDKNIQNLEEWITMSCLMF